jgi:hypothetical protein
VRPANLIDAKLADARLDQPVECALNVIRATQWPVVAPDIPADEIVEHVRDCFGLGGRRSIVDRVLSAINALAQVAGFADGLKR